jgi:hypothetical protein
MNSKIKGLMLSVMALSAVTFSSCDDILETKNFTDISPSNFYNSESDIDAALTGIYLPCTTNWGYSDGGTGGWYNALFNSDMGAYLPAGMLSTDIMRPYSDGNNYEEFTVGPANTGALTNTYNVLRFIARATDVIDNIENSSVTESVRNKYAAEARTLRAYYLFVMLDWFGPVNAKLDPATLSSNTIEPRPDEATYVNYILNDLQIAIDCEDFPTKYNSDADNWGRMSKAIAYTIRLKLYMHQKEWAKAKADAETIMGLGYSLLPNYEDIFNGSATAENIWSIPSNTASDNYYITEILPSDFMKGYYPDGTTYIRGTEASHLSGWAAYCMRWEFFDTFEANDVRRNLIITEYDNNDGNHQTRQTMKGAIPIKFTNSQFYNYGIQKEQPIYRYADVLLCYAEAENELNGPTGTAVAAVKQVTDRAGVTIPASATANKDAFRDYILLERGHELYCEGHRRQDLIRNGSYISGAQARGFNAKSYQVLYPIPQDAIIEAGGILVQNEGY